MSTSDDDLTELVVDAQVPAPVTEVWPAWTTAEGLARWWWPHWPDTVYEMAAEPGGRWSARSEHGGTGVEGEVVLLDEPHVIQLTWRWDGGSTADTVRVELAEAAGGTWVTVRHRTRTPERDDYREGWTFVLGNLRSAFDAPAGEST